MSKQIDLGRPLSKDIFKMNHIRTKDQGDFEAL